MDGFNEIYSGSGFTENPDNPSNTNGNPFTVTYPCTLPVCEALQRCLNDAVGRPWEYASVDLHFRKSSQQWECVEYSGYESGEGDFNVKDDDVVVGYGYQMG